MVLSVLIFVSVEIDLDINARRNLVMKSVKSLCSFYFQIVSLLIIFPENLGFPRSDTGDTREIPDIAFETTESFSATSDFDSSIPENITQIIETEKSENHREKDALVKNLTSVGAELTNSLATDDQELIQNLLTEFKQVWFQITDKSNEWHGDESQDLRIYAAKILFLAKYNRLCESPDQTFFNGQCLLIGDTDHCPDNMELNDGPKNEGFCDCLNIEGQALFYSDETGNCHVQNTRVPFREGQWVVFNKAPKCEPVPHGCPADGQHVYWGSHDSESKKCWEIGCQGPCSLDEILHLEQNTDDSNIYCRTPMFLAADPVSLAYSPSCRVGTLRNRLGKCSHGFWG